MDGRMATDVVVAYLSTPLKSPSIHGCKTLHYLLKWCSSNFAFIICQCNLETSPSILPWQPEMSKNDLMGFSWIQYWQTVPTTLRRSDCAEHQTSRDHQWEDEAIAFISRDPFESVQIPLLPPNTPNIWKHICQITSRIATPSFHLFLVTRKPQTGVCLSMALFSCPPLSGFSSFMAKLRRHFLFSGLSSSVLMRLVWVLCCHWDPWAVLLWMGTVTSLEPACADPEGNSVESVCSH